MGEFDIKVKKMFEALGEAKNMVLSTTLNNHVTSRMMSIIILENDFYFQTDKNFRKYEQIRGNHQVALCLDNVQIEGICHEVGKPIGSKEFCEQYEKFFKSSYERYTLMQNERLFRIEPTFIQKWIYENGIPFVERFDFAQKEYEKIQYKL